MDRAYEANASTTVPTMPAGLVIGYPPDDGIAKPGPWWFHMITEEVRNVLVAGGVTPDAGALNQLATAITNVVQTNIQAAIALYGAPTLNTVNTWTSANRGSIKTLSYAVNLTVDMALSNNFAVALAGNCRLVAPSAVGAEGQSGCIIFTQNASLGSLTFSPEWDFIEGIVPVNTKINGAIDILWYHVISPSQIQAVLYTNVK